MESQGVINHGESQEIFNESHVDIILGESVDIIHG